MYDQSSKARYLRSKAEDKNEIQSRKAGVDDKNNMAMNIEDHSDLGTRWLHGLITRLAKDTAGSANLVYKIDHPRSTEPLYFAHRSIPKVKY